MRWNQLYASTPICNSSPYAPWTFYFITLQCGVFLATIIFHLGIMVGSTQQENYIRRDISMTIGCINFLSCCASFMTLIFDWGGVCEDIFRCVVPSSKVTVI